jgi:2-oxo-4-hydroxy-4-carboxy--5-ureidoimidazoline (OHCU) decarboxylase
MSMQRVQLLLEPTQRKKLAKLAQKRGKSVSEITRQAIDIGLEQLERNDQQERLIAILNEAKSLRNSMPVINLDVVTDIHLIHEERDNGISGHH